MRFLNVIFHSVISIVLSTAALAQDVATLPAGVRVITSGYNLPAHSYSLLVQEIGADTPLLAINTDQPFNPASSIKTLTTLAALEVLGPAYNWKTEIHALGAISDGTLQGDLLI